MPKKSRATGSQPRFSETVPATDPLLVETVSKSGRGGFRSAEIAKVVARGQPLPADVRPILWLMGGGSGSGKSTVLSELKAQGFVPDSGAVEIDPDDFKEVIPEFQELIRRGDSRAAAVVHEESTLMARTALAQAMKQRANIILDTTLSAFPAAAKLIRYARLHGYEVRIIGVTAALAKALARSRERAERSGRFVLEAALCWTHQHFAAAFEKYVPLADAIELWKTDMPGGAPAKKIARKQGASLYILDERAYRDFQEAAAPNEDANDQKT